MIFMKIHKINNDNKMIKKFNFFNLKVFINYFIKNMYIYY